MLSPSCSSSCASLPSYSCGDPPKYNCRLSGGEQVLQVTPRLGLPLPCGVYVKRSSNVTVSLFDQEEGAKVPAYGRDASITGAITLDHAVKMRLVKVVVKVTGILDLATSEEGSTRMSLIKHKNTLWIRQNCADACPTVFPFSYTIPRTTTVRDGSSYLPPSYNAEYPGLPSPSLFVKVKYSVSCHLTFIRNHTFDLFTKVKRIEIPFQYLPRSRSHRPFLPVECFFSSMKALPEEWSQVVTPIPPRPNQPLEPLHCQFFVPSSKSFGIRDKIPFHIQLSGPLSCVKEFIVPPDFSDTPSMNRHQLKGVSRQKTNFKVSLVRLTGLATQRTKIWRHSIIGTAEIVQVVPPFPSRPPSYSDDDDDHVYLDWEGEISIDPRVQVGGFNVGDIFVRDNIILCIQPFSEEKRPTAFRPTTVTVPIRLVTDSYVEEGDLPGLV